MTENEMPSGHDSAAGGGAEAGSKDTVSYASYQKLLGEKKAMQAKVEEFSKRMEAIEAEKLESAGKLKELNDHLKKQLTEKEALLNKATKTFGEKVLKNSFVAKAKELGCVSPDDLWNLTDKSGIEIGADYSFKEEDLVSVIQQKQKEKSFLFQKEAVAPRDGTPVSKVGSPVAKPLADKSPEELVAMLKALPKEQR